MVSESLLSLWQAGRKTYAMVSDRSPGPALASELVESHDGHEEIIKVSLVHVPFFFLLPHILQVCEGSCCLTAHTPTGEIREMLASSWSSPAGVLTTRVPPLQ